MRILSPPLTRHLAESSRPEKRLYESMRPSLGSFGSMTSMEGNLELCRGDHPQRRGEEPVKHRRVRFDDSVSLHETFPGSRSVLDFSPRDDDSIVYDRTITHDEDMTEEEKREADLEVASLRVELFPNGYFYGDRRKSMDEFSKQADNRNIKNMHSVSSVSAPIEAWGDEFL
eukprot:comp86483_c0_seq1/m.48479 comp86483_c0_seq1/g.48479  ORF comp86483_c0_seq1/g.48479 comp86483_c0_seq1/m.48479 type:complete len:172 (-) comp86483_c0_seq1:153-668(-)